MLSEVYYPTLDVHNVQLTWVPATVPHCFVNAGSEILEIYWVYAGLNVTRTICATGETSDHLSGGDNRGERPVDPDEQRV